MALYRLHFDLAMGGAKLKRDSVQILDKLSAVAIAKLTEGGAISEVNAPPLVVLPGWKTRGARLAEIGVTTFEQFWRAENETIAKLFNVKDEVVNAWRAELARWVVISKANC